VLCQHILIRACAGPFDADALFAEVRTAGAYADLPRATFDRCLDFCATGGYALRAYDQWQRLMQRPTGCGSCAIRARRSGIRMNIGTIVEADKMAVRLRKPRGGKPLGEVEEYFALDARRATPS
jgi:ATP-dependent Lhr-like helicase